MSTGEQLVITEEQSTVKLRELTPLDATALFALVNDDREHLTQTRAIEWGEYSSPKSVAKELENLEVDGCIGLGIWREASLVGRLNLYDLPWGNTARISYFVGRVHRRQGVGATAAKLALGYAYRETDCEQVNAHVLVGNLGSARMLDHSGFHLRGYSEGSRREKLPHWVFTNWKEPPAEIAGAVSITADVMNSNKLLSTSRVCVSGMTSRIVHPYDRSYAIMHNKGPVTFAMGDQVRTLSDRGRITIPAGVEYQILGVDATMLAVSNRSK